MFDDDLHTLQWHNVADWLIIGLIVLSTVEIFLSTFDGVAERCGNVLGWIDLLTQVFFTIEVSLRIWNADMLDPKYKGFKGRLRYCFSFYGLIDILATYPFYANYFVALPVTLLKTLRVLRLLRVFRYMHSFQLLSKALNSKKSELLVSMNFLVIVTVMLSFVLFFVEHEVQPEVYENGWSSVVWAFAQYIGDPGGFADMPPMTLCGKIVACLVGIMGIAIVAVPAGLVGSAFTDVMDEEKHDEEVAENEAKLELAFERKLDRPTRIQICPPNMSIPEIQANLHMSVDSICEAVDVSSRFRLVNLASTQPTDNRPDDRLAVEHFVTNRSYGCCIDRGSNVTIVSPASMADAVSGWYSFYLAALGRFNYVSREVGAKRPYRSYYLIAPEHIEETCQTYLDDINRLGNRTNGTIITFLSASGANEPELPTQLHLTIGGKRGDETLDGADLLVHDKAKYADFYKDLQQTMLDAFGLQTDHQRFHDSSNPKVYIRQLPCRDSVEAIVMRMAWSAYYWDSRRVGMAKKIAESISRHYAADPQTQPLKELSVKDIGFRGYSI